MTKRSGAKRQPRKPNLATAQQYMCYALHAIPDDALLAERISPYDYGSYTPQWAKPALHFVPASATCVAYMLPASLALLPMPLALDASMAPYAIAYEFVLSRSDGYCPVAQFYGFTIATLPAHDIMRAKAFAARLPDEALCYADRALLSQYRIVSQKTSFSEKENDVEKTYRRYTKLRDTWTARAQQSRHDALHDPESLLTHARAIEQALKCYSLLTQGKEDKPYETR